jgi:hypothetical protein
VHHLDSSNDDGICWITLVGFNIVPVHHLAFHGEGRLGNMGNLDCSAISFRLYSLSERRWLRGVLTGTAAESALTVSIHPHRKERRWKYSSMLPKMVQR